MEPPEAGAAFEQGDVCASVESVKAVSSIYAPITGTVTDTNDEVTNDSSLINSAAESEGWMFKVLCLVLASLCLSDGWRLVVADVDR